MGAAVVEGVEVKNCPHCGSEARIMSGAGVDHPDKSGKPIPGSRSSWFWVKCSNFGCGASHVSKPSAAQAAELWNARA